MRSFNIIQVLIFLFFINACAQPGGSKPKKVEVSFFLNDTSEPRYSLINHDPQLYDVTTTNNSNVNKNKIEHVEETSKPITFDYNVYGFGGHHHELVLYKGGETMNIHFTTLFEFPFSGIKDVTEIQIDLGEIPFSAGKYVIEDVQFIYHKEQKIRWNNHKLIKLESGLYKYNRHFKDSNKVMSYVLVTEDFQVKTDVSYYNDPLGSWVKSEKVYNNHRAGDVFMHREYLKNIAVPNYFQSYTDRVEIDSLGIIKERLIYEHLANGGVEKWYRQKHHIGKHYTEVKAALPAAVYPKFNISQNSYDQFITSPVIIKNHASVQLSNAGYYPQDSIIENKFLAHRDSISIQVKFYTGADTIGEPIIEKTEVNNEITYTIYLIESIGGYDFGWSRSLEIPLIIEANKKHKIIFPLIEEFLVKKRFGKKYSQYVYSHIHIAETNIRKLDQPLIIYGNKN